MIASVGSVYVPVPVGTRLFAFGVAGDGPAEAVSAVVRDPSGREVGSMATVAQGERFTFRDEKGAEAGLWELRLGKPAQGGFEDFHVEALGVPGYLFLSRDRYWTLSRE